MLAPRCLGVLPIVILATTGIVHAQDPQEGPPPQEPSQAADTGLPSQVTWTFSFDAGWGVFGFGGSLYTDPKEGVGQDLGNRWMEGFVKPALSATYTFKSSSELYGRLSVVGERTYAKPPPLVGVDQSSFLPEDLTIGWRSGTAFESLGENVIDLSIGRTPYTLGHGLLIWDGAAEGGSRGGYWSNARKAYEFAAIVRVKPRNHTLESFYLAKDDLPEHQTGSRVWGVNYEYGIGEGTTVAATYMKWWAKPEVEPQRDDLNVYNLRTYTAPIPGAKELSFEFEYAAERNGDALHSHAWVAQAAYEMSSVRWTPTISYRYASFEGDDPATPRNEAFDPLFLGFSDWGAWWQGEIAGEYFLVNSNLTSHQLRLHVAPGDAVSSGVMFYQFLLDHPAAYAPGVTDGDLAFEIDFYTDWEINERFTASFVAAFADPQEAVRQSIGRTQNFKYGMVFLAYSY